MITPVPLLSQDKINRLPERAREVVEYRKSGLSLNHIQGCSLGCAYCIRHTYGLWDENKPVALMPDAEAVVALVSHRYFQPHVTPIQHFNRATEPFRRLRRPRLHGSRRSFMKHPIGILRLADGVLLLCSPPTVSRSVLRWQAALAGGGRVSVEKIAAEFHQVLDLLDLTTLVQALELIDQAEGTLAYAVQGSQRPEAAQAVALLGHVKQQLGAIYQTVQAAQGLIQQYLANLAGGTAAGTSTPVVYADRPKDTVGGSSGSKKLTTNTPKDTTPITTSSTSSTPKQIEDILATLPPEVPKPNPSGKKTHGKVVGSEEVITSGEDAESDEVWQRLVAAGVPEKFTPMAIDHVEMKVGLRMVKSGKKHVELTINNRPCRGLWSCRALLPLLLPEGYTLTVYGPNNYRGTFTGGKKWSN